MHTSDRRLQGRSPATPAPLKKLAGFVAVIALAGCSGALAPGGPAPEQRPPGGATRFAATVVIPARTHRSPGKRRPLWVSPASEGLVIISYPHGSTLQNGSAVADVSANSALCTKNANGTRTCTVYAPAPVGDDDFTVTDYDMAPVSGSIPTQANVLAFGNLSNFTVVANQNNSGKIPLQGRPVVFALTPVVASLPADGKSHGYTLGVDVQDADGNTIVTAASAPFNAPITLTVTEANGSGHVQLLKNNAGPAATQTTYYSSDAFQVSYDGGGSGGSGIPSQPGYVPAYSAAITISSQYQLSPQSASLAPLYLTGTPGSPAGVFAAGFPASITFTASGQVVNVQLQQALQPTTGSGYGESDNCAGLATVTQAATLSTQFAVTAATGSVGSCTINFTDGVSTYPVAVST